MKLFAGLLIGLVLGVGSLAAQEGLPAEPPVVLAGDGGGQLTREMFDRLVDFFEWSLDEKLSPAARAGFEQSLVTDWRGENCGALEGAQDILQLAEELKHLRDEDRSAVREKLQNLFRERLAGLSSRELVALVRAGLRNAHGRRFGLPSRNGRAGEIL